MHDGHGARQGKLRLLAGAWHLGRKAGGATDACLCEPEQAISPSPRSLPPRSLPGLTLIRRVYPTATPRRIFGNPPASDYPRFPRVVQRLDPITPPTSAGISCGPGQDNRGG
jgi:hypothetical protein